MAAETPRGTSTWRVARVCCVAVFIASVLTLWLAVGVVHAGQNKGDIAPFYEVPRVLPLQLRGGTRAYRNGPPDLAGVVPNYVRTLHRYERVEYWAVALGLVALIPMAAVCLRDHRWCWPPGRDLLVSFLAGYLVYPVVAWGLVTVAYERFG